MRADEKSLAEVLEELSNKKFSGRLEFAVTCDGTKLSGAIELLDGKIVAAELELPSLVRGSEALRRVLEKWVRNCRGYAEIVELDRGKIDVDLAENPAARVDIEESTKMVKEALQVIREVVKGKEEGTEEEMAPTAPLVEVSEAHVTEEGEYKPSIEGEVRVEERIEKQERLPTPLEEEKSVVEEVEAVPSTERLIERLDSSLFDATIVLRGTLSDSGAIQSHEVDRLVQRLIEVSRNNPDKTIVAFVNDRLNEIRGKLVAYDGILVAALVKRENKRLLDADAIRELASFERPLLYSIYLIDPSVDETLHKLAQESARRAREATKLEKEEVVVEAPTSEARESEERKRHEHGKSEQKESRRRRFLLFFRRGR
ncbi:hypothetical protein [Pyrolobus fumarii]|uniref:hypothetical protein n=1 Tax=Pyrolobus fumarii TaxID=54252 RepID=UPI00064F4B50|nr:hypothetical protein [Pyrolobus fumarii]